MLCRGVRSAFASRRTSHGTESSSARGYPVHPLTGDGQDALQQGAATSAAVDNLAAGKLRLLCKRFAITMCSTVMEAPMHAESRCFLAPAPPFYACAAL